MPCPSGGFRCVHCSSTSPISQGLWFRRVHRESLQFKIFADGNADARGIDLPVSFQMKSYSVRVDVKGPMPTIDGESGTGTKETKRLVMFELV
jgi:hypothetical protein